MKLAAAAGVVAWLASSSLGQGNTGMTAGSPTADNKGAKQIIVTTIPSGYRDWKFVSAAHEAGDLNDIRVVIGNDKALKSYREGKPFPDGSIFTKYAP